MTNGGSGHWTAADAGDQHGRVAVITGATSGLGLQAARVLAQHGATVVLTGRDPARLAAAAGQVRDAGTGRAADRGRAADTGQAADRGRAADTGQAAEAVQTAEFDLASLDSVRAAAAELTERFPRLDLLINNGGVMYPPYSLTKDGFELQFGTNHLGHFALTGLLLPVLLAQPGSRVVTVASNAHRTGRMNFADLQSARHYSRYTAYGRSKLANLMFTYELHRRLAAAGAGTIAVAAHPGTAHTDLTRHMSGLLQSAMGPRLAALNSWAVQDASMGTLPILRAATDPDAIGGTYYGPDGFMQLTGYPVVVASSTRSQNREVQRRLWVESEQLTGVTYPV